MAKENQAKQNQHTNNTPPATQENPASQTGENASPPPGIGLDDSGSDGAARADGTLPAVSSPAGNNHPALPGLATRRVEQGTPYCARHNVLMVTSSSQERAAYYKCPVPGCQQTDKRARPTMRIPSEPLRCPQRSCSADDPKSAMYLEVNGAKSTPFQLRMECPRCSFQINVPRPGVESAVQRARLEASEDLDAR